MSPSTIDAFWQQRGELDSPRAARFHNDHDPYDLELIASLCGRHSRVLDLGAGTCVVPNALVEGIGCRVHAVDYVEAFLGHAIDDPRLTTEVGDARTWSADREFDLVLSLGVVTSFETPAERTAMYENCAAMLAPGGHLLVKAQFGVHADVVVDTWSEDLGAHYRAVYAHLPAEVARLEAVLGDVVVHDVFPPHFHRWETTAFRHLVARKR